MKAAQFYKLMGIGGAVIMVFGWLATNSSLMSGIYGRAIDNFKKVRGWGIEAGSTVHGNFCSGNLPPVNLFLKYITVPDSAYAAIWVDGNGDLTERLNEFNTVLEKIRNILLEQVSPCKWTAPGNITTVLDGRNLAYLSNVSESGHVVQVMLTWIQRQKRKNMKEEPNLIVQNYYQWTASPNLCKWIKAGITNQRWHIVYNNICETNTSLAMVPVDLAATYLNSRPAQKGIFPVKYPSYFHTQPPSHVTFLMVALNAVFTHLGDMYTNNVKVVPFGCSSDVSPKMPMDVNKAPLYDEVFTISQYWGAGFYHKNIEDFPRLAAFLPFLLLHKHIKLHVFETGGYTAKVLNLLGITSDRLIGGVVRAKIAYMPEATYCGFAHPTNSQLLSKTYRNIIHNSTGNYTRDSVVLIRRSRQRRFTQHGQIKQMILTIVKQHNLTFKEFIDNPVPTLGETMKIFNRAVMVVGPHGAGLSNIIFSEPGTFIIEGVCNRPHVNMCFNRLAHVLGHRWHGIESRGGCEGVVDVHAEDLEKVVKIFIKDAANLAVK